MQIKYLQVLIMPNGEILSFGKTIGWVDSQMPDGKKFGDYVFTKAEVAEQKE